MFLFLISFFGFVFCVNYNIEYARNLLCSYSTHNNFNLLEENEINRSLGYGNDKFEFNGEFYVLKNLIKNDFVVFDAGANKGEWSREVLGLDLNCKVYAFEPVPEVYAELVKNNFMYKDLFIPLNFGLGLIEGYLTFYYTPNLNGMSSIYNRPVFDAFNIKVDEITVPVQTLDGFISRNQINKINYLKIDTEGSEFNILMGAKNSIQNDVIDIIQFEYGGCYKDGQKKLEDVYNYLKTNNYLLFRIIPNGYVYIQDWTQKLENYTYSNYVALKNK
jgi:FkbM family methyltransferase